MYFWYCWYALVYAVCIFGIVVLGTPIVTEEPPSVSNLQGRPPRALGLLLPHPPRRPQGLGLGAGPGAMSKNLPSRKNLPINELAY